MIHAGLQAAEKGVPFLPLRGILGSDLVRHRPDWRVIDNPFGPDGAGDPILLVPAIRPDVALFHAARADRAGNVWIGVRRELMLMAHAARTTLVTVEEIVEDDLLADDRMRRRHDPGALRHARSRRRAAAPGRSACAAPTRADLAHLRRYAELAADRGGLRALPRRARARARAGGMSDWRPEELLIDVLAGMLDGARPRRGRRRLADPGRRRACSRASARAGGCGSRCSAASATTRSPTAGASCSTAPRRGGSTRSSSAAAQIDGEANINLVGVGGYPASRVRWPGSFGSAYLYFLVPRVILFREEHTPRVLVPKVEFVSAPGTSPANVYRPGGPYALVTGRAVFRFERARARFRLQSVHPGPHASPRSAANTGFDFDLPGDVAPTPAPVGRRRSR